MDTSSVWNILPKEISRPSLVNDVFWNEYEQHARHATIHLAILIKPYLELILSHNKTLESRFSLHRRLPYKRIRKGDIILLKQSGGPIKGIGYVSDVWFYKLENGTLGHIKEEFGDQLQIYDQEFWARCEKLSYATLIKLDHVRQIPAIKYSKKDRNAWAIFEPKNESLQV